MTRIPLKILYLYQDRLATTFSHTVSIIFTGIVILTIIIISIMNKKLNDSLPYRLSIFILFGDLLFSCSSLTAMNTQNKLVCSFSFLGVVFSTLISLLYTLSIGLNLYITVVYRYYVGRKLTYSYYLVPLLLSIVLSSAPLVFKKINLSGSEGEATCWFDEGTMDGILWAYSVNYGWIIFSILFCLFICVRVTSFLLFESNFFKSDLKMKQITIQANRKVIIRLLIFPLIPIICYTTLIIKLVFAVRFSKDLGAKISIASSFFKGLQGFLNGSLFLYNSIFYKEVERAVSKV
ncbi:hypothetical protein K502DRAFT_346634 [Neoconidiobolus thromboides FSU 785]|nr:hypothetical protein K502DRAFT_346634 [Neoconidiobolus thromboides FSU 785]